MTTSSLRELLHYLLRTIASLDVTPSTLNPVRTVGRHLVGVWIGGLWNGHFPESEKYFSDAEISRKMPEIPQKERFLPNFRL